MEALLPGSQSDRTIVVTVFDLAIESPVNNPSDERRGISDGWHIDDRYSLLILNTRIARFIVHWTLRWLYTYNILSANQWW